MSVLFGWKIKIGEGGGEGGRGRGGGGGEGGGEGGDTGPYRPPDCTASYEKTLETGEPRILSSKVAVER